MKTYESQELVKELGSNAASIRKKTVTVIGLGGIGSAVAEMLARMGVNLRIIDKDRVYEDELPRLSLFTEEHVSKFKAKEAKKILESINKDIKIKAFHEELVDHNAYLIEADVIVECSGNLSTALLADKAAKKKPLIYARATGTEGHIFIADDVRLKDITSFLEKHAPVPENKAILGSTVRMTAALAVNKVLKILTGQKHEKNYLVVNGWKFTIEKQTVRKNPQKKR